MEVQALIIVIVSTLIVAIVQICPTGGLTMPTMNTGSSVCAATARGPPRAAASALGFIVKYWGRGLANVDKL